MPLRSAGSGTVPRDAVHHPLFARYYARFSVSAESRLGLAGMRDRLLAGLSGRVIEIGAGNGLNFAHYPGTVSEVVAIEPERNLRRLAVESALRSEVPVDVAPGAAEKLPVKSEAYDAVVLSLVLCSVRDVRAPSRRYGGCCGPVASCGSSSTAGVADRRWRSPSAPWTARCGRR